MQIEMEKNQFYSDLVGKYVKVVTRHGSHHLGKLVSTENTGVSDLSPHLVNEMLDESVGKYYINDDPKEPLRIDTMTIGSVQPIKKEYLENIVEFYKNKSKEKKEDKKC